MALNNYRPDAVNPFWATPHGLKDETEIRLGFQLAKASTSVI